MAAFSVNFLARQADKEVVVECGSSFSLVVTVANGCGSSGFDVAWYQNEESDDNLVSCRTSNARVAELCVEHVGVLDGGHYRVVVTDVATGRVCRTPGWLCVRVLPPSLLDAEGEGRCGALQRLTASERYYADLSALEPRVRVVFDSVRHVARLPDLRLRLVVPLHWVTRRYNEAAAHGDPDDDVCRGGGEHVVFVRDDAAATVAMLPISAWRKVLEFVVDRATQLDAAAQDDDAVRGAPGSDLVSAALFATAPFGTTRSTPIKVGMFGQKPWWSGWFALLREGKFEKAQHEQQCGNAKQWCDRNQQQCGNAKQWCDRNQQQCGSTKQQCDRNQQQCSSYGGAGSMMVDDGSDARKVGSLAARSTAIATALSAVCYNPSPRVMACAGAATFAMASLAESATLSDGQSAETRNAAASVAERTAWNACVGSVALGFVGSLLATARQGCVSLAARHGALRFLPTVAGSLPPLTRSMSSARHAAVTCASTGALALLLHQWWPSAAGGVGCFAAASVACAASSVVGTYAGTWLGTWRHCGDGVASFCGGLAGVAAGTVAAHFTAVWCLEHSWFVQNRRVRDALRLLGFSSAACESESVTGTGDEDSHTSEWQQHRYLLAQRYKAIARLVHPDKLAIAQREKGRQLTTALNRAKALLTV